MYQLHYNVFLYRHVGAIIGHVVCVRRNKRAIKKEMRIIYIEGPTIIIILYYTRR